MPAVQDPWDEILPHGAHRSTLCVTQLHDAFREDNTVSIHFWTKSSIIPWLVLCLVPAFKPMLIPAPPSSLSGSHNPPTMTAQGPGQVQLSPSFSSLHPQPSPSTNTTPDVTEVHCHSPPPISPCPEPLQKSHCSWSMCQTLSYTSTCSDGIL